MESKGIQITHVKRTCENQTNYRDVILRLSKGWTEEQLDKHLQDYENQVVLIPVSSTLDELTRIRLGLAIRNGPSQQYYVNRFGTRHWPHLVSGRMCSVRLHLFLQSPDGTVYFTLAKCGSRFLTVG